MDKAKLFLNKVIDNNDVKALDRFNITREDMPSDVDRETYDFIRSYSEQNGGRAPSYAAVASEVVGFEYIPEVSDHYSWLAEKIKAHSAKIMISKLFERPSDDKPSEFERNLNDMSREEFLENWLPGVLESVKMRTSVRKSVGTDIKRDADKFLDEYQRRKAGESFNVYKSRFSAIGEYISGNMYTVYGESGRGKSVVSIIDAIYAAMQGANVLVWGMEMPWFEIMVRIYVFISGDVGMAEAVFDGEKLKAGFDSRELRFGKLSDEYEAAFEEFVRNINEYVPGNIVIRAVDHEDFQDRSLQALSVDIETVKADYVVIDPFYYLHYEKNTSKTTGGDAANTSQKLRAMAGRTRTVIVAITQADETKSDTDEDDNRELKLPERDGVKKTSQLLEDAYQLIAVDTDYKQGRGLVGVNKGRDGGEGNQSEILYIPQVGIVKEMDKGEIAASGFGF